MLCARPVAAGRSLFAVAPSRGGPAVISDEGHDSVIRDECDAAQLSTLPNPNEMPIALFFAFVVVAATKSEVRIATRLGKPEELWTGLRRSIRAFASRGT